MNGLEPIKLQCPYCWEMIDMTVDCSVTSQEYVEDCEVCCKPIVLNIDIDSEGKPKVEAKREN